MVAPLTAPAGQLVTVLAARMDECRAVLAKLQKRGARYGQALAWTETPRTEDRGYERIDGKKVVRLVELVDLVIIGEAPRVGDYELQAALERTPGGVIVSSAPGVSVGKLGREWDGRCDHCGSDRTRVHGYLVVKGRTRKVVGKSCLRDFLGTDVPANIASRFAYLRDVANGEDDGWGGFGGTYYDLTVGLIAAARAAIKLFGWRPSSYEGQTTLGFVAMIDRPIIGGKERDEERRQQEALRVELRANAAAYQAEAEQIVEWARNLRPGRNDYLHNLQVACAGEVVKLKHRGLVVSACAAFDRQKAVEAERKAAAAAAVPSTPFGEVGTRYRDEVVRLVRRRILPDNGYGESTLFSFVTAAGCVLTWITGSDPRVGGKRITDGTEYRATFTVKAHRIFRDQPETTVSRMVLA